jgi:hypothetical protein
MKPANGRKLLNRKLSSSKNAETLRRQSLLQPRPVREKSVNGKFRGSEKCKRKHLIDRLSLMLAKPRKFKNNTN